MKPTRIFDLLSYYQKHFPGQKALGYKENGEWKTYTIEEYIEFSNLVSYGLLAMGLQPGAKVGIVTANRPEWNFFDMGITQAGFTQVPIYTTLSDNDMQYVLEHSEAEILILGDKPLFKKISPIANQVSTVKGVYTLNELEGAKSWKEIIELGKANREKFANQLEETKKSIKGDDIASIIYTSGTTGLSKGVMLSHNNLISNGWYASKRQHLNNNHKVLSFLPLCHVYERVSIYQFQFVGATIYYAENIGKVPANINELQVDGFSTVPRLLEAIYDKIMQKGSALTGVIRKIFDWSVKLAENYDINDNNSASYKIKLKIADKLVYTKWRDALSQNLNFVGSGGSALHPRLARIFWAAGMPVFEGYGLTETSPIIAVNCWQKGKIRIGTVGAILEGTEVKIAEDGEILCKGENVMLGYFKNPEMTKEVIDSEGWFHTGDIGHLEDGLLKITDRKKEIFKMSNGKYIAPQPIENLFKQSQFITQLMIVGENEKFASAIISPNFEAIKSWAKKNKITFQDAKELIENSDLVEAISKEIKSLNKNLAGFEQIKKFKIVPDEWTPFSGELSPTLKLKRKVLKDKYKSMIDQIYQKISGTPETKKKKE